MVVAVALVVIRPARVRVEVSFLESTLCKSLDDIEVSLNHFSRRTKKDGLAPTCRCAAVLFYL